MELHRPDAAPGAAPIFTGTTDTEGVLLVELAGEARPPLDDQGKPVLLGRVVTPGMQQRVAHARRRRAGDEFHELVVVARAGATARGQVRDEAGAGVDADVSLEQWTRYQGLRVLESHGYSRRQGGGRFELHLDETASGSLVADAGALGTGCRPGVKVDIDDPPQDLVVVVHGAGVVRGRVTDSRGVPVAGLQMRVQLPELDVERDSLARYQAWRSELQVEGAGQLSVEVTTDLDGRFEATGLRLEDYVVALADDWGHYSVWLTEEPLLADGVRCELQHTRRHLVVRLLDAEGKPSSGSERAGASRGTRRVDLHAWPSEPKVFVMPCDGSGPGLVALDERLPGTRVAPGTFVFDLEDGCSYRVGAVGGGFDGTMQVVHPVAGSARQERTLTASDGVELARVAVSVWYDGAELTGQGIGEPEFALALEQVETHVIMQRIKGYGPELPYVFQVPAGNYRVVAEGEVRVGSCLGNLVSSRRVGRVEALVTLLAGVERSVALELRPGGLLAVTLSGVPLLADRTAVKQANGWLDGAPDADFVQERASRAELTLRRDGRRPEIVRLAAGQYLLADWPLGTTNMSQMLPVGTFELVGRMPGGREVRVTVELREGRTTAVELAF